MSDGKSEAIKASLLNPMKITNFSFTTNINIFEFLTAIQEIKDSNKLIFKFLSKLASCISLFIPFTLVPLRYILTHLTKALLKNVPIALFYLSKLIYNTISDTLHSITLDFSGVSEIKVSGFQGVYLK